MLDLSEVEEDWARKQFASQYENQVRKLLLSFALATRSTVTLWLNGEEKFTLPREGQNAFCRALRETPWGGKQCSREDQEAEVDVQERIGTAVQHTCYMGMDNISNAFEILGLGIVNIRLTRIPPESESLLTRGRQELSKAQSSCQLTAERSGQLQTLLTSLEGRSTNIAAIKSHFQQLVNAIRETLHAGITRGLMTRSLLHEISISLAATGGSAEYIVGKLDSWDWLEETEIRARMQNCLHTVADHMTLARHLADNLLDYHSSREKSDVALASNEEFHLSEELISISRLWEPVAHEREIEIKLEIEVNAVVSGDIGLLRRLFNNLYSNAVKYSYSTSKKSHTRFIQIKVYQHDPGFRERRVAVSISNYGVGLTDEEVKRVGELGFRGRSAIEEQPVGLGLGVYIARRIARLHGGEIRYKSEYLHDTKRHLRSRLILSQTYRTEALVLLPSKHNADGG